MFGLTLFVFAGKTLPNRAQLLTAQTVAEQRPLVTEVAKSHLMLILLSLATLVLQFIDAKAQAQHDSSTVTNAKKNK